MASLSQLNVNGVLLNRVRGTVVKGYITRYCQELEWEDTLVEIPSKYQLVDGDALPYYLRRDDGKFYEYYGYYAPEGQCAYISEENFSEHLVE